MELRSEDDAARARCNTAAFPWVDSDIAMVTTTWTQKASRQSREIYKVTNHANHAQEPLTIGSRSHVSANWQHDRP
eukprot:7542916-Pyramimonas_sp.AAC.1